MALKPEYYNFTHAQVRNDWVEAKYNTKVEITPLDQDVESWVQSQLPRSCQ